MLANRRGVRRLIVKFAAAATGYVAATVLGAPAWAVPVQSGDQGAPCRSEQVAVTTSPTEGAVGHRALTLTFSLVGAEPCTLTGYPAVDSGTGGPLIHAQPTLRGYMGGLPSGIEVPPNVLLSISTQAQAIVEGVAMDGNGGVCPSYTDLLVSAPNTVIAVTVPATIDACTLQVHPVTAV